MAKCFKCGKPHFDHWKFCSDPRSRWRPVCIEHDIQLNEMALKFAYPRSWERKLEEYKQRIGYHELRRKTKVRDQAHAGSRVEKPKAAR